MKQSLSKLSSFLLAILMFMNLSVTTLAADSIITFKGLQQGFAFQPGSEYTATDLFDNFKNVMPGDRRSETIQIKNTATDCDYIKLYIRAVVHDEDSNPLTYSEPFEQLDGKDQSGENQTPVDGQRDETVATMQDFLSQLSLKLYHDETLIYEASPDELGGLQNNVYLATLGKGAIANLTVELSVPISLGNEYANRVGEVDWVFLLEGLDYPDPPAETPDPGGKDPQVIMPPKTGDTSPIVLLSVLVCISVVVLIGLFLVYRRKKKAMADKADC